MCHPGPWLMSRHTDIWPFIWQAHPAEPKPKQQLCKQVAQLWQRETVRLWCAVPTSKKFTVQLLAVVIRQAGPAPNILCRQVGIFQRGGGWLSINIWQGRGHHPPTSVGVRKLAIALLCGIKITEVHHLALSQYMHITDRRRDGQTDIRTDCDSNTLGCVICSRTVKTKHSETKPNLMKLQPGLGN